MSELVWIVPAAIGALAALIFLRSSGRAARIRAEILEEVRRSLRSGVLDAPPGRSPQARGRIGELEITVDLHSDPARPVQSPMWRILAVGPVGLDRPIEVRIAGWKGWIDPWLQLGETVLVPAGMGPEFTVHAEHSIRLDHPVIASLRRQGAGLGPGAFHARPDLMRAEVSFGDRLEDNRALFSYLHAMGEIAARPGVRAPRERVPSAPAPEPAESSPRSAARTGRPARPAQPLIGIVPREAH